MAKSIIPRRRGPRTRPLRRAEAGEVARDHAVARGEVRNVLEPVLPTPREPVDEDDRRPGAHLDVVDPRSVDGAGVQMLLPVDVEPFRAFRDAVAVVLGNRSDVRGLLRPSSGRRAHPAVYLTWRR